jgi:hypothetical protein
MKGYKGFNEKFQCTPEGKVFQYEVGKEYSESSADLCRSGFHFCENPIDVLRYYQPAMGRYAEVEAEDVSAQTEQDSKRVAKKLKIIAEIKLKSLIELGVKFLLSKTEKPTSGYSSHAATSGNSSPAATSGYYSPAATSGYSSPAATSGYYSPAATSGYYSPAATSGYYSPAATSGNSSHAATSGNSSHAATSGAESIAAAIGRQAKAKAALGNWLVLAEYEKDSPKVLSVKTAKVDGKKIKADTFYELKKGKFVAVK